MDSADSSNSEFMNGFKKFVLNELNNPETSMSNMARSESVKSFLQHQNEHNLSPSISKDSKSIGEGMKEGLSGIVYPKTPQRSENDISIDTSRTDHNEKLLVSPIDFLFQSDSPSRSHTLGNTQNGMLETPVSHNTVKKPDRDSITAPVSSPLHPLPKINAYSRKPVSRVSNDHELELLANMVKLPLYLEKMMAFSLLGCFNLFLYYFTMIPLRFVYLNYEFVKRVFANVYEKFFKKQVATVTSPDDSQFSIDDQKKKYTTLHKSSQEIVSFLQVFRMDFILLVEQIITCMVLILCLDTSKAYHKIKGQNAIKLYALFGVLEMADKMLSTIGQDLLLTIYRRVSNSTIIFNNKTNIPSKYFILLIVGRWVYLMIHSTVLIYQTVALNVAVNSYSNTLGTLLLSMQFAELKSSVFKKFDKEGLFQLTIADVVERFQLISMLAIIALRNLVANKNSFSMTSSFPQSWNLNFTFWNHYTSGIIAVLCGPMLKVIGSEFIVDWLKHGYISRFNRFKPEIYDRVFRTILVEDSINHTNFKLQARLGVPIQAQVVTFIVLVVPKFKKLFNNLTTAHKILVVFVSWLVLLSVKLLLQLFIKTWCKHLYRKNTDNTQTGNKEQAAKGSLSTYYVPGELNGNQGAVDDGMRRIIHNDAANIPPSAAELRLKKDSRDPKSLDKVERYKMSSKRIW